MQLYGPAFELNVAGEAAHGYGFKCLIVYGLSGGIFLDITFAHGYGLFDCRHRETQSQQMEIRRIV